MSDLLRAADAHLHVDQGFAIPADVIAELRESSAAFEPEERHEILLLAVLGEIYRYRHRSAASLVNEVDGIIAVEDLPNERTTWLRLSIDGYLASAEGRRSDALQSHQEALNFASERSIDDGAANSLHRIGEILLIEGDSAGAIGILADLVAQHTHDPMLLASAQEFLADTLVYSGAHKLAREHYEDALRAYSAMALRARSRILRKLTSCLLEPDETAAARECLDAAREIELVLGGGSAAMAQVGACEMRILAAEERFQDALVVGRSLGQDLDVHAIDAALIAEAQSYLALGLHAEAVALWDDTVAATLSAAGASRLSSIVGKALEADGDFRGAVEIEEVNYANVRRRSLELAPLLQLAGQLESLVALRRRKSEINLAWRSGTDLVHEVEEVSELLVSEIDLPLQLLSAQLESCEPSSSELDSWFKDTMDLVAQIEGLLSHGMERANLSMTNLEVPAGLVIERVCRRLDGAAVNASVKLHRGDGPRTVRAKWEHSDELTALVAAAISNALPGSTVVVAASADRPLPFEVSVR